MHLRRTAYPIVDMQAIDAVRQVGYVDLYRTVSFISGLPRQIPHCIVQADIEV